MSHVKTKATVALVLTFAAGCVDIVGYLVVYKIFTSHMTGDTVHLAYNVLEKRWPEVIAVGCVLAAFVAASVVGRAIIEVGVRREVSSIASVTLLLEAVLIAIVAVSPGPSARESLTILRLCTLAAAMGLQTATITRIGSLTVHTTFVTGMLNKLAQLLSHSIFLSFDLRRDQALMAQRAKVLHEARFLFSIWVLYLMGALVGSWTQSFWGAQSLLLPVAITVFTILIDQRSPLSVEEERDQA